MISANANAEHYDHLTGVKLPLVHRDKLSRVLSGFEAGFGMDVVDDGLGRYLVTLGVGSPVIDQTLVIDTGSDLTWIQCQACERENHCFLQPNKRFDPSNSRSLGWVSCSSDMCIQLKKKKYECNQNQCIYQYGYADKTYIFGNLANETLTINGTAIPSVILGCSDENYISFNGEADGMLGLGRGPLSYTTQPNGQTGQAFRFCLGENGWLHFGYSNFPGDNAKWASLILNDKHPSLYYIELLKIEVEGNALNIREDTFQITDNGDKGGVIIDTGTSLTYLPEVAYNALRDTVKKYLQQDKSFTPITSVDHVLDTCYNISSSGFDLENIPLPRISFIFQGMNQYTDPPIQVNATNILIMTDDVNITCLAFAPSTMGHSILAGRQLEGIQITIHAFAGYIGFGPTGC